MITLRHFGPEDAESIHHSLYPDLSMHEIADLIGEWESCVHQGKYFEMFAIVCEGRAVGCASLCEHNPGVVSAGVEVFAAERRKGFASDALGVLIEYAAKKDYRIILDQVRTDNQASIRLHEKLGFVSDGSVYHNRRNHAVFLFIKPLT